MSDLFDTSTIGTRHHPVQRYLLIRSSTEGDGDLVELRHLEYFLAVAERLSFTDAAKRLHVVQSGVSATIRALERELGSDLFARTSQRVTLTAAGRALLPRAREVLHGARAAADAVRQTQGSLYGKVTVGTLTSINLIDMPELLSELRLKHPGVTVGLRAAPSGSAGLVQQVRDGHLDVAFMSLPGPAAADLNVQVLASVPLILVVPDSHPLAGAGAVSLAQIAEFPFVDSPPGFGNRVIVDNAFAAAGLEREVTLEVSDIATATAYIRRGLGIGFLSDFLLPDRTGLDALHIADKVLHWRLQVATSAKRHPSAALQAFLHLLAELNPPAEVQARATPST
jgi:DNA-binding transcriptional LysR family regulator